MPIYIQRLPITISSGFPCFKLYHYGEDNHLPVGDFLVDLNKSRQDCFNRLLVLFKKLIEVGRIVNQEQFKAIEGHKPIYEFKAYSVRIYCFRDGDKWVLVEGDDDKKSDNSRSRNMQCIIRAENRYALYWQAKNAGKLEVRE